MKKIAYTLIAISTLYFFSCKNDNETTEIIDTFYEDYYNVNIAPANTALKLSIENQILAIEDFKTNPTNANFENLREQWRSCATSFAKTSTYNINPVKLGFYDTNIFNFPINTELIEDNIKEQTIYNTAYLETKSTVTKGLGTLEYLFFNVQDSTTAFLLLEEDTFRVNYALAVAEEVLRQTNLLISFWEDGYKDEFANSKSISCTVDARCLAFNQLINLLDIIKVTKLGKPAGLETSENIDLEILQAFRSETSLDIIKSSIQEVEYTYSTSTVNFSELVDEIAESEEISNEINSAFIQVYNDIDAINSSLYSAILNNDPNVVELHTSLTELIRYFSVDAASTLSVTVLPTDNDGD